MGLLGTQQEPIRTLQMNQPNAPAIIEPAAKDNEQQEDVEAPIDEVCER